MTCDVRPKRGGYGDRLPGNQFVPEYSDNEYRYNYSILDATADSNRAKQLNTDEAFAPIKKTNRVTKATADK